MVGRERAGLPFPGVDHLPLLGRAVVRPGDHRRVPGADALPHDGAAYLRGPFDHPAEVIRMEADLCRYLPWDSEFFGVRIAHLNCSRLTSPVAMNRAR